jgi:hypothetical protein
MAFYLWKREDEEGTLSIFCAAVFSQMRGVFGFFGGAAKKGKGRKYGLIKHHSYGMNLKIC